MWTWQPTCALNYLKLQFSVFSYCFQTEVEGLVLLRAVLCVVFVCVPRCLVRICCVQIVAQSSDSLH